MKFILKSLSKRTFSLNTDIAITGYFKLVKFGTGLFLMEQLLQIGAELLQIGAAITNGVITTNRCTTT